MIWEETLGPNTGTNNMVDPYFIKYQVQAVQEMVQASMSHPSVIMHAFYNEGPDSDPKVHLLRLLYFIYFLLCAGPTYE